MIEGLYMIGDLTDYTPFEEETSNKELDIGSLILPYPVCFNPIINKPYAKCLGEFDNNCCDSCHLFMGVPEYKFSTEEI